MTASLIKGRYATATCYAKTIEQNAIDQIRAMCDMPFANDAHIAIMPDAHPGAGCTIGTTMTVTDKVCPNLVGVDIGCGMFTIPITGPIDLTRVDEACHKIPSGREVWDGRREHFDLTRLRCYRSLKDTKRLERSLGTLGGGNHFVEVDQAANGTRYLVIHTGSRNLGLQVANLYQKIAVDLHSGKGKLFDARECLIADYKAAGRQSEIQTALKQLEAEFETREPDAPADLCWLEGHHLDDYLHDMGVCQEFATKNREHIAAEIADRADVELDLDRAFHTRHNYIDLDEMVLRKGAIAAHEGELVLIPLNMRDGSILAHGKGNRAWNNSAPHGAGRLFSRAEARRHIALADFESAMTGIYTTSVDKATIDESPMAYKDASEILEAIADTVDIIDVIKPIYNFKAAN